MATSGLQRARIALPKNRGQNLLTRLPVVCIIDVARFQQAQIHRLKTACDAHSNAPEKAGLSEWPITE